MDLIQNMMQCGKSLKKFCCLIKLPPACHWITGALLRWMAVFYYWTKNVLSEMFFVCGLQEVTVEMGTLAHLAQVLMVLYLFTCCKYAFLFILKSSLLNHCIYFTYRCKLWWSRCVQIRDSSSRYLIIDSGLKNK